MNILVSHKGMNKEFDVRLVKGGIKGFEIHYLQSYTPPEVFEEYAAYLRGIKDTTACVFSVHAPIVDVNMSSPNRNVRRTAIEEIKRACKFGTDLGAEIVVVHPRPNVTGMPGGEWSKQEFTPLKGSEEERYAAERQNIIASMREIAEEFPTIRFCLENLVFPHEYYRGPRQLLELVAEIDRSNVGVVLDMAHAAVSGYNPREFLQTVRSRLFHVHMSDNHGIWDEHLPLGCGTIDFPAIFAELNTNYSGFITLEFASENPKDYLQVLELS